MPLRVVTPPVGGLISLEEAKAHLQVLHDDDDVPISALILAASATVEAETQRLFLSQTVEWVSNGWPCWPRNRLPVAGPKVGAIAIESVTYADVSGAEQTLDPSLYWGRAAGETLRFVPRISAFWPCVGDVAEAVVVRLQVTGEVADVHPLASAACKLIVGHLYANRSAVVGADRSAQPVQLPLGVEGCCGPLRWN